MNLNPIEFENLSCQGKIEFLHAHGDHLFCHADENQTVRVLCLGTFLVEVDYGVSNDGLLAFRTFPPDRNHVVYQHYVRLGYL